MTKGMSLSSLLFSAAGVVEACLFPSQGTKTRPRGGPGCESTLHHNGGVRATFSPLPPLPCSSLLLSPTVDPLCAFDFFGRRLLVSACAALAARLRARRDASYACLSEVSLARLDHLQTARHCSIATRVGGPVTTHSRHRAHAFSSVARAAASASSAGKKWRLYSSSISPTGSRMGCSASSRETV